MEGFVKVVTPKLETCTTFHCGKQEIKHNIHLVTCVVKKFLNPLLRNYGKWQTDVGGEKATIEHNKAANRKYLTF